MSVYINDDAVLGTWEAAELCRACIALELPTEEMGAMALHEEDLDLDVLAEEVDAIIDGADAGTIDLDPRVRAAADRLSMYLSGMTPEEIEQAWPDDEEEETKAALQGPSPFHDRREGEEQIAHEQQQADEWEGDVEGRPFDDAPRPPVVEVPVLQWVSPGPVQEKREALRDVAEERIDRWEAQIEDVLSRVWERQKGQVLARLTGTKTRKHTRHWDPPGTKDINAGKVMDIEQWADAARDEVVDVMGRLYDAVGWDVLSDLGEWEAKATPGPIPFSIRSQYEEAISKRADMVADVIRDKGLVIQDVIRDADMNGLEMRTISDAVRAQYDGAPRWAKNVAQWQVNGALNEASLIAVDDQYGDQGVRKEWLSSRDKKVRSSHSGTDGQVVDLNKPFRVGWSLLQYPHDPNGDIAETVNCRCTLLYTRSAKSLKHGSHNQMDHGRARGGGGAGAAGGSLGPTDFDEMLNGGPYGSARLSAQVEDVESDDGETWSVSGIVTNEDGDEVGEFNRYFTPSTGEVHHSSFELEETARGTGFAKEWMADAEQKYVSAGYTHINITAVDDGSIVWAKMGYEFPNGVATPALFNRMNEIGKGDVDFGLDAKSQASLTKLAGGPLKPIDVARFNVPYDKDKVGGYLMSRGWDQSQAVKVMKADTFGEVLMRISGWTGRKELETKDLRTLTIDIIPPDQWKDPA